MKYRLVKNPQLLTLVNPGKPPKKRAKKAGGQKVAKKTRKPRKRKLTKAQRAAISRKNLRKARAALKSSARRNPAKKRASKKSASKKRLSKTARREIALKNLEKARAARRKKHGWTKAGSRVSRASAPRGLLKAPRVSNRRARTQRAKRYGVTKQGWYPVSVTGGRASMQWVGNAPKRRRKAPRRRKQTAKQRAASMRNLKKARRALGYKSSPKRRTRKSSKRRRRAYRRNQGIMAKVMPMLKQAVAGGVGFFSGRLAGNFVAQQTYVEIPETVRPYAPLAASVGVALAAPFVLRKLQGFGLKGITQYTNPVVVGALVSAVESAATLLLPADYQSYVAPPMGMGDALSVYERALSGYAPVNTNTYALLAADDGVGEYITEPGVGEYITEPGVGEYITEPGVGEYITEPGVGGVEIEEAFAGVDVEEAFADYDLAGIPVEEAVAGLNGFSISADEGLADHIYKNETNGGLFGESASVDTGEAVRGIVVNSALQSKAQGKSEGVAAQAAYRKVKAAMGLPTGNAQLRTAVVNAVHRAFAGYASPVVRDVPEALPTYQATSSNWPVDGAPGPVAPIDSGANDIFGEPTPVADPLAANVGGIFRGSIFSNDH